MVNKTIYIPSRLKNISKEDPYIASSEDIVDDDLGRSQRSLNAEMKSITDQMVVAIEGGSIELSGDSEDIAAGSGKVPNGNAVYEALNSLDAEDIGALPSDAVVLKGFYKVATVSQSGVVTESPAVGTETGVIYVNGTSTAVEITIRATPTQKTPTGEDIVITIPVDGYAEANYSNIGGIVYVRGI